MPVIGVSFNADGDQISLSSSNEAPEVLPSGSPGTGKNTDGSDHAGPAFGPIVLYNRPSR